MTTPRVWHISGGPPFLVWSQEEMNVYAEKAFAAFGKIDVLVNNVGYSYMGAIEESGTYGKTLAIPETNQFDINAFRILRLIRGTLPSLRAQGKGAIMNFFPIGELRSFASNRIYPTSRFALERITQALDMEIAPFGLYAVVVEPGYFGTFFLSSVTGRNIAPIEGGVGGGESGDCRAVWMRRDFEIQIDFLQ